jgi:hypothetical protein
MKTLLSSTSQNVKSISILHLTSYKLLLTLFLLVIIFTDASKADAVSDWNATAVTVQGHFPAQSAGLVDLAYLHIAIYDAVNAIDGSHPIFAIDPPNKVPWANLEAAVHSAARRILMSFYPADSVYIESVYQSRMSFLPNDSTTTKGVEIGNTTAAMYLSMRSGDGRLANIPYVWQPLAPGVYQPTPPSSPQYTPVAPWQAQLLPFSFGSSSEYRAPAPPLLTSAEYTADFNEVKMYGSIDITNTTPEMREIAFFHTENPGIFWPRNLRLFASSQNFSLTECARFFAQIFVSVGDALISGWNSKYYYNRWRPSTAIRYADIDGNPSTEKDTLWQPLAVTPRHPEYPAAHGVVSGAVAYTIERFFGTPNISFTLNSTVTGTQHTFTNIYDFLDEIANARVWGGMHFRTSCDAGFQIGQIVANHVADEFRLVIPDAIVNLISMVQTLPLNNGNKNSLTSKLENALAKYNSGKLIPARNIMNAFLNELNQFVNNGKLTATQAQPLIDYANEIIDAIHSELQKQGNEDDTKVIPEGFTLQQNYPNPFNPSTRIRYSIPNVIASETKQSQFVSLKVYDVLGNEVATLVNEEKPAGSYEVNFNASQLSSGIYFYKLQTGNFAETKKMLLLK